MKNELIKAIVNMEEDKAIHLAQEMLDSGDEPFLVLDACRDVMTIIGNKFEEKEFFLPELVVAGDMLAAIGEIVKPHLKQETSMPEANGKVVIGTVAGDIHDIGKDIVSFMLDVNSFSVIDLGVDVPADKFINTIKEESPEIVALSGFLTLAYDSMKDIVEAIAAAGLGGQVKIMIGGAPMDDDVCQYIGADAFGKDATVAVRLAKNWMGVS